MDIKYEDLSKSQIKALRHPAKLPHNIAKIFIKQDYFNMFHWKQSTLDEKISFLNKAYRIMAKEACISPKIIKDSYIYVCKYPLDYTDSVCANVNLFITADKRGEFHKTKSVFIGINKNDLINPLVPPENILAALYHEVIHIMQQQCLCEGDDTFVYSEMQREWKNSVLNMLKNKEADNNFNLQNSTVSKYLSCPVEVYAYMQTEYFRAVLISMKMEHEKN